MRILGTIALMLLLVTSAGGQTMLFEDDLESDLSQWTGTDGGSHHGVIVADPLDPTNNVLSFTALDACGDIFSVEFPVEPGRTYRLVFDYLGHALPGSPPGHFGGTIGIADENGGWNGAECVAWLASTILENNSPQILQELADDGSWHTYSIAFDPYDFIADVEITDGEACVAVEDWNSAGSVHPPGVPGDAFFDNIRVEVEGPVAVDVTRWSQVRALYR